MQMRNKINKCKYYALDIKLISPMCVSGGISENTDSDVLRNGDGELFVPGTSLAGAFRNYIGKKKDVESSMGYSKGNDGKMSSIFISDLYIQESTIGVRDRVKLDESKQVDNKFDTEIIETGATGVIYISYVVRENDAASCIEGDVKDFIRGMQTGEIRIGSDKNRGFGRMSIEKIYVKEFDFAKTDDSLLTQYISFRNDYKNKDLYKDTTYEEAVKGADKAESKYVVIKVPLKLTGGISIRKYSARPGEADYEQIKCNGKSVIPGTSWNGAIRSDCVKVLKEAGCKNTQKLIDEWFGWVDVDKENKKKTARQSRIVFAESVIEGGKDITMTRNKINRFDASTVEGALYTEVTHFGGETILEIMIKKDSSDIHKAMVGMISLVISDIEKGYTAIGGLSAIGRGIFEAGDGKMAEYWDNGEMLKDTAKEAFLSECASELYCTVKGGCVDGVE